MHDDPERIAGELARKRRRSVEAAALALVTLLLAAGARLVLPQLFVPLLIGGLLEILIAISSVLDRRYVIQELAADPRAYVIPEVERYGSRFTRLPARQRMASWINHVLAEATLPGTLLLPERVERYALELHSLAKELASPAVQFSPATAVQCLRLLACIVDSPLYNPNLPAEDLGVALSRIRADATGAQSPGAGARGG
jgi:hypothetical protein